MGERTDLAAIAARHAAYPVEAYAFIGEGMNHTTRRLGRHQAVSRQARHLTALELVDGICDLAAERYGLLGPLVLASWRLRRSEDVGAVTFHLVDAGVFGKRPEDRVEDFDGGPTLVDVIQERARERLAGEA